MKERIAGLNCGSPEEVLYNLFSCDDEARKVFERIINIDSDVEVKIENHEAMKKLLETILTDEEKKKKLIELLKKSASYIKGGEIITEAIGRYSENYSGKELDDIVNSERDVILQIIETAGEQVIESDITDIFSGLKGVAISDSKEVWDFHLLKNTLTSFNENYLLLFYEKFTNIKIKQDHKDRFDAYVYGNLTGSFLTKEKLISYVESGFDPGIEKSIDNGFIDKEAFREVPLREYVENGCRRGIEKAIDNGFIDKEAFREVPLREYVENRCRRVVEKSIDNGFINKETFREVPLREYVENGCGKVIEKAIDNGFIDKEAFREVPLRKYVENRFDPSVSIAIDNGFIDKEAFQEVSLREYVQNECDWSIQIATEQGWIKKEEVEKMRSELKNLKK